MNDVEPVGWTRVTLDGPWSLVDLPLEARGDHGYALLSESEATPIVGRVPGEVHLDLMSAGRMEDPSLSDNARSRCRWPEERSWWYRTAFVVPVGFRRHLRQRLVFEAIDLYAQIFVNGRCAGTSQSAFSPVAVDVSGFLRDGANELVVRVTSGMELAPRPTFKGDFSEYFDDLDDLYDVRSWDQRRPLRKPDYSAYGHDWCDALPNIGICGAVRLEGHSGVTIHHVRLDTVIDGSVALVGEVTVENLHPWSEQPAVLEVDVGAPDGRRAVMRKFVNAQPGRSPVDCRLEIDEPQLWWPNGLGDQPLYTLSVRVVSGDCETDRSIAAIGLRTIELDRTPLPDGGARFCFKVNGHDLFCKGGNWAPADLIPARVSDEDIRHQIARAKAAHFNMLRVNGVGIYERGAFYSACDRAGILVWQDFSFSDAMYPDWDDEFVSLVRAEAEAVVQRLRHHPSLAIWCGNNECALSMASVWGSDPAHPAGIGGVRLYNQLLPDICRLYDPGRPYWPSSPCGGLYPNSEMSGDVHGMGELSFRQQASRLEWRAMADDSSAKFYSETFNLFGPPSMSAINTYLSSDERRFNSTPWRIHVNAFERGATLAGINDNYGGRTTLSMAEFVLYGQLYQALLVANAVESARFRKHDSANDCQGMLVWSFNETWGEVGWALVDHYLHPKASYYAFRRSAAPVKVIVRSQAEALVTRVVNDTLDTWEATVQTGWIRLDGSDSDLHEHSVVIRPNSTIEVDRVVPGLAPKFDPSAWVYAAQLHREAGEADQCIWPLLPYKELARTSGAIVATEHDGFLKVTSDVYQHAVHLEPREEAVVGDNYFDLLPGVPHLVPLLGASTGQPFHFRGVLPLREEL